MSVIINVSKSGCSACCILSSKVTSGGALSLTFVRWRKPRWIPKAASKIYRVRTPTKVDPDEAAFLKEHQHHYSTELRAIKTFLFDYEMARVARSERSDEDLKKAEEDDWKTMIEKNSSWNFEVRLSREADMVAVEEKKALNRQTIQERDQRERMEMLIAAEQKFLQEKENFESFITPDKLDSELDKVLNTRSDYDFALQPDGTTTKDLEKLKKEDNKS